MSCSGQHFSIHSPDCKAHMSIQSNRPIQVDPLSANSRVTTPTPNSSTGINHLHQYGGNPIISYSHGLSPTNQTNASSSSPSMLQIQTLMGADCGQLSGAGGMSPVPSGGQGPPLVGQHQQLSGDGNYTLVILDCSPHPPHETGSADGIASLTKAQQRVGSSASCDSPCRDCHSGCHCQTELIVRQQIEHDHSCQHHGQHYHHPSQQQTAQHRIVRHDQQQLLDDSSQRLLRQFGSGSIADRSASQATTTTNNTITTITTTAEHHENQQQQRIGAQIPNSNSNQQQQVAPPANNLQQQQRQQQQQHQHYDDSLILRNKSHDHSAQDPRDSQRSQYLEPQQQQQPRAESVSSAKSVDQLSAGSPNKQEQSPVGQSQSPARKPREGTRIVKRWNWNQAQFVEEEVPDTQATRPHQFAPPSGSADASRKQHQQNRTQADLWNQEIQSICSALSPIPSASQQQYDPSWLAYRKPDEESVQADPLYRDLMMELQRLEEGVVQQQQQQSAPEPVITPDCFQKPVFGQPIQPDNVELEEHETVEFIARLIPNSDPTMRVEWTKNGRPLMESSRLTSEYEFGVVRLAIRRCEAEDSGIYQCRATNLLGEAVSRARLLVHAKNSVQYDTLHPAGLDKIRQLENPRPVDYVEEAPVQQPPKFLSHIQDYVEKDEGDSVHFECCLAPVDDPDMKTEWFFNGRPLVTGSRFHTIDDFGFIVLDIDWLFPRDTGEYICRATNKHGTSFTRTVLRVRPAKNIILDSQLDNADVTINKLHQLEFPDVPEEVHVEQVNKPAHFVQPLRSANNKRQFVEGDNVHFEARVGPATDGELQVEWFHNDKPLISGHRFKPTFDFGHILLDILYVYPEDSGVYKCVARNRQGVAVSEVEIQVQGKQSIVYQSQLPREMLGGVEKITEMEAMWNRPPDPEEEEAPMERMGPQFVLNPKPCTAFEGSCARFCCRILAHPRPRVAWFINGQLVVNGLRYKLTYDGMYHLIIPKCQLSDAGKVEVRAKNLLGECACETQLTVKRKVDDYRSVLKNSPNPWYDEQTLKLYRRQRNQPDDEADDEDFEEFLLNFQKQQRKNQQQQQQQQQLRIATELQSTSPQANQLVGYMEPETPDVNLLVASFGQVNRSPLVEPGDLHPVVLEQQAIHAPAPSTIKWALAHTGDDPTNRAWPDVGGFATKGGSGVGLEADSATTGVEQKQQAGLRADGQSQSQVESGAEQQQQQRQVFGVSRPWAAPNSANQLQANAQRRQKPPASPENVEHGKEVHSHFHTQLQVERRQNKEITREIIEKETFEQEHKGFSKDNLAVAVASSDTANVDQQQQQLELLQQHEQQRARSITPIRLTVSHGGQQSNTETTGGYIQQQVLIEDFMIPPEFVQKIQPCQAIDGDEARFECKFRGEPRPTISWYRESKLIKPSNLYTIETDFEQNTSRLIIKRVTLNGNAVYTVKAENAAGSAKSSANLVVEPHPLPQSARGGQARQFDALEHLESNSGGSFQKQQQQQQQQQQYSFVSDVRGFASPTASDYDDSLQGELASLASRASSLGGAAGQQKVVKSVRTRRMSPDELASLIRASPDNLIAPTFLHTIHEVHAKLGELARLDARLIGSQPMEVKWMRDGQRVRADKQHKLLLEGDLYTLLILECSDRDEGYYECVASNSVGEARCGASLRVTPEGRQSSTGSTSSYVLMQSAISGGAGSGASTHQAPLNWRTSQLTTTEQTTTVGPSSAFSASTSSAMGQSSSKSGSQQLQQQVSSSQSIAGQHQQQQQQRQHFGLTNKPHHQLMSEYTSSSNDSSTATPTTSAMQSQPGGTTTSTSTLALPRLIKGLENQQVREGKSVTLRCQISAFPKAEIAWFRQNDKQIKPSKYFRIFKDNDETHCLKILETFPEDQGEYKCVARAQNGQIETRAFISVLPSSPK